MLVDVAGRMSCHAQPRGLGEEVCQPPRAPLDPVSPRAVRGKHRCRVNQTGPVVFRQLWGRPAVGDHEMADVATGRAERTAEDRSRSFHILDILRGLAAISVITLHYPQAFAPFVAIGAYLAVDLFFVMSGFVLARAYDVRLKDGMGGGAFITARLIRLYPFYLLALALGIVELAYYYRNDHLAAEIMLSGIFNVAMLPSPPVGIPYQPLFPANFVAWTLSFELLANAVYGFGFRFLTVERLRKITSISGLVLLALVLIRGNLNGGAYWPDAHLAAIRVTFSFFVGVLIHRAREEGRLAALTSVKLPQAIIIVITIGALGAPIPPALRGLFDAACVLFLFPLIVAASAGRNPVPSRGISAFLGEISYPIYVLQIPVFTLGVMGLPKLLPGLPQLPAPWSGFVLLSALCIASWFMAARVDIPARRRMNAAVLRHLQPG